MSLTGSWISSSNIGGTQQHWTYNTNPSVLGIQRSAYQPTAVGSLWYKLSNSYTFKSSKMYMYEFTVRGNFTGIGLSASFSPKNSSIYTDQRTTTSVGVNAGTGGRYYFYNSPPSNQAIVNTIYLYATGSLSGNFGTSPRIDNLAIKEFDWLISGYKKYIPGLTQGAVYWESTTPGEYRKYNGWSYESDIKTLWWSYKPSPIMNAGGLEADGDYSTNYISKSIPYSVYNLTFEFLTVGGIAGQPTVKIYQGTSRLNAISAGPLYTLTQSQFSTQSTVHQIYGLQGNGNKLYFVGQTSSFATGILVGIINPVVEGGYHPINNDQFLFTDSNLYYNPTQLQIMTGTATGMTYSIISGSGSTINGTPSNLSIINALVGNGTFRAGVWENGVWNSGWRVDQEVYEFDNVGIAFRTIADRRWRIQITGPVSSVSKFTIGDRISIGNIVAIDINETRKLLKGYFTIINITTNSIVVETDVSFPFRRIERDSDNHKIKVTKNVWLSGAFLNGYFAGVWNYGLFKGFPYITEMYDTTWIDGIFDGGHFNSTHETYRFVDTYYITGSSFGLDSTYDGKLGLSFSIPHGYLVGDIITINKDDKSINPNYDGDTNVLQVVDDYLIITDRVFGSSSTLESGTTSNTKATGLIQNFTFFDNNIASKVSSQTIYNGMNTSEVFLYQSWIDVNYDSEEAVNIGKEIQLYDDSSKYEYSLNNLYGYPTSDVLSSVSTFRDSYSFTDRNYKLGTKYKIYTDGIGKASGFNRPFDMNTIGLKSFIEDGWTFSGSQSNYERSSENPDWNSNVSDDLQIKGEELVITSTFSGTLLNNINIDIETNRYSIIEYVAKTYSVYESPNNIAATQSLLYQNIFGSIGDIIPIPTLHYNNINQFRATQTISFGPGLSFTYTYYSPMLYIPVMESVIKKYGSTNVVSLSTSKIKKYEYFFNKPTLSMKFLGSDDIGTTFFGNYQTNVILDDLKYYEVDMIPFFQYFIDSNIYKGVSVPWQGIAPFIDYENSSFSFIDNINIGLGSIQTQQSFSPVSGVGIGISTGGGFGSGVGVYNAATVSIVVE